MDRRAFAAGCALAVSAGMRPGSAWAQTRPAKRICIVQSQEFGHPCGQPQADGVLEALAAAGWVKDVNLTVRSFAMDMYRLNVTPALLERAAAGILAEIETFRPDVVFALDDAAIAFVMVPLVGTTATPIVFSGMNAQPEAYNARKRFFETWDRPGGQVTGVYEKLYLAQSMKVMQQAIPDLRGNKVVLISDMTVTGDALARQFELELAGVTEVQWEVQRVRDWLQYKDVIGRLNEDPKVKAIYPIPMSVDDGRGDRVTFSELYDWTIGHSRKPEIAPHYFFARMGFFGGAVVNFGAMGRLAGQKGAMILSGRSAGDIPMENARDYAIVFNVKRARDLGVQIPVHVLTAADAIYKDDLLPLAGKDLVYDPRTRTF